MIWCDVGQHRAPDVSVVTRSHNSVGETACQACFEKLEREYAVREGLDPRPYKADYTSEEAP